VHIRGEILQKVSEDCSMAVLGGLEKSFTVRGINFFGFVPLCVPFNICLTSTCQEKGLGKLFEVDVRREIEKEGRPDCPMEVLGRLQK
jgi:hypothetical protein